MAGRERILTYEPGRASRSEWMRTRIARQRSQETRFLRADLVEEVFKILRGFENVNPERFFQVVGDDGRRGHCYKLFKRRYRLDVGRFKFASRVCEEWNRLDGDIVAVDSVNGFKRKLDHHLRNVRGVFLSICFFPLLMAIHGNLFLGSLDGSW